MSTLGLGRDRRSAARQNERKENRMIRMFNSSLPSAGVPPKEVLDGVRGIRDRLGFQRTTASEATARGRVARLSMDFIRAAFIAIAGSPQLLAILGRPLDDLRQDEEFAGEWTAVGDELRALLNEVDTAVMLRRHRMGILALQTLQVTRQLVRDSSNANLLTHLEAMDRFNEFRNAGTRKAAAAPPTPTTPK
jgi:hypothetical protein